ncbi:MAG: hypothetical protein MJZ98_03695, partial [Paludibacteraceae bacterium]|nr:hypothetical protein [Paludibacteraceae bacterium]
IVQVLHGHKIFSENIVQVLHGHQIFSENIVQDLHGLQQFLRTIVQVLHGHEIFFGFPFLASGTDNKKDACSRTSAFVGITPI